MKFSIFFLALFHSVFILAQEPDPVDYNIHKATLCLGDSMQLGDKSIKFKKVVQIPDVQRELLVSGLVR